MRILAIETSCDDTGIAILQASRTGDFKVLSNIISSQTAAGKKYGGVFPAVAKREHQKNLVPTFVKALKKVKSLTNMKASKFVRDEKIRTLEKILEREPELEKKLIPFLQKCKKPDVDFIAITNGPGLEPCLWVGVNFVKALSYFWNIPIISVNHVEGHILVNFLENPKIQFPAVALVVSGGHTQIILVKAIGKYEILGETRDDAAGECFDKCAKILGLAYPGGPAIAKLAEEALRCPTSPVSGYVGHHPKHHPKLPRPMINTKDYDFSFSGLKTAVLYAWQKIEKSEEFRSSEKRSQFKIMFAAEIQQAIIDVLIKKTMKAAKDFKVKTIILGGGVSANKELRIAFFTAVKNARIELLVSDPKLSTDNALMIAIAGYFHRNKKIPRSDLGKLSADSNLRIV